MLGVLFKITRVVGYALFAGHLLHVAVLLHLWQQVEVQVEHVLLGPHLQAVGGTVGAVVASRGHHKRYFIFIVVVLHIRTQADEHRHITVLETSGIVNKCFVVHKHLQTLVDAQVKARVPVHATGITCLQVFDLHLHRLLIELSNLRLTRVDDSAHARWQHIVHRLARSVLLNVHCVHINRTIGRSVATQVQVVVIVAPLATHQFQACETQVGGFLELSEEHAHEANGSKVVDRPHPLIIFAQRNAELVPGYMLVFTIAGALHGILLVDDEVAAHLQVFGPD